MDLQKLFLTLITPVIAAGSAWLAAVAAKHGMNLDPSGVNALAVAGATAGTAAMVKLIHDLEKRKQVQAVAAVAKSVDTSLVSVDPKANQQLEDLAASLQAAAQARFDELASKIQPAAPPVVAAPAPVPDPPPAVA